MVLGDGIRRNITTVTQEERIRLKNAIIALHTSFHYPGKRGDEITGGVSYWFKQDEIHAHTHVHECPAFIPWHREMVNRFEDLLREFDSQLSLHYWDWTTSPKPLFTQEFMGSASGDAGEPWLSAGFYVPGAQTSDLTMNSILTIILLIRHGHSPVWYRTVHLTLLNKMLKLLMQPTGRPLETTWRMLTIVRTVSYVGQ